MSRRGALLFAAMCVIWGLPYLLIKVAVDEVSPVVLVFLRTGVGAALLVPIALGGGRFRGLRAQWRPVLAYTFIEVSLPWLLLSDAERRLSSSLTGLLVAAVPLVGALLVWVAGRGERIDRRRMTGLLVGLAGVALVLGLDVGRGSAVSVAELVVVTVCYATGPMIVSRRLAHLPVTGVVAASLGLTCALYAPPALTHLPAAVPPARALLAIVVLGVICTALAFVMFFALIAEVGPARATVITYLNPAVAILLGVTVLGEAFTATTAAGFALILSGSYLATRGPSQALPPPAAASVERAREPAGAAAHQRA